MAQQKYLIVIGGPTASGKTAMAIRIARHFKTEILSADSRQFFEEMTIGTAKPEEAELRQAPHHFIGHRSIQDSYSVGAYERDALDLLERLFEHHDVVVLTGGSGLYIKALCEGLDAFPAVPEAVRVEVQRFFEKEGLEKLQEEVRRVDPAYFAEVDRQNPVRLIRALAVWRSSGRPFSSFRKKKTASRPFTPIYLQLHLPRPVLYDRINRRVDLMLEKGLVEEARKLDPHREENALQTVGYSEWFEYFDGNISFDEAVRLIKRNTRRYAKRQLTWMRRDGHWKHIGPDEWETALAYIDLVRHRELYLVQKTQKAAVSGPAYAAPPPDLMVYLQRGEQVTAQVPLYRHKNSFFIGSPQPENILKDRQALKLLLHESVHCTEFADCFINLPREIEPFFREFGFENVAGELLPKWAEALSPAVGDPSTILLFRKGD